MKIEPTKRVDEMMEIVNKASDLFDASRKLSIGDVERERVSVLHKEKIMSVWNGTKTKQEADIAFIKAVEI